MVRSQSWLFRAFALSVTAALLVACGGSNATPAPGVTAGPGVTAAPTEDTSPQPGGTLYLLTNSVVDQWNQIDPQRMYTGEDMAFLEATIYRGLTAFKYSADPVEGTSLVPDLATDLGTTNADATEWKFTLRDGSMWQDGSPVTCEDVKYGVSRTFANNVITDGPTYQVQYLDIPANPVTDEANPDSAFLSAYYGPYDGRGQDLYDKAVSCDGNTITFKLNGSHADFNYTTTLGFAPVPKAADTGESYGQPGHLPVSNGPYMVESYTTGVGGKMVLVRNPTWTSAQDGGYRKAYPDKWEVNFGVDDKVLDQRLIASAGNDQYAMQYGSVEPENLAVIFQDAETPLPEFAGRAISGFDPYSLYYFMNTETLTNVKIRQAMAVALDRAAILKNNGGSFFGTMATGVIKPNIGIDYADTGFWTTFFGQAVPDSGDPELAKKLIAESGIPAPALTLDFSDTSVGQKNAAIVIESLGKAGFVVTPNPIASRYYATVSATPHDFGGAGWGADWPNASTVIAPLYTFVGGWNLSRVDDDAYAARIAEAFAETDRAAQAKLWQALDKTATENAWVIPTFFGKSQTIAGKKVGGVYRWAAYGSWPYGEMYVTK